MATESHHSEWARPFVFAVLACLGITTLTRVLLLAWLHGRVAATGGTGLILLQGLRFDLVTLGILLAIPLALTPIVSLARPLHRAWFNIVYGYLVVITGLFVFMEAATPTFISEYDVRPNLLFFEYLEYPHEVVSMLWTGYKLPILAGLLVVFLVMLPIARRLHRLTRNVRRSDRRSAIPLAIVSLVLCVMAARSTLDHRPVNPSTVAFSPDTLVNSLPLNSLYTVMYAAYSLRSEEQGFAYGEVDEVEAVAAERAAMGIGEQALEDPEIPTLHYQAATVEGQRPLNLVIIVEESLGAEYVGALGGLALTPNLDRLADDGIWFENLYATGTRSARGLEAIVTGFPPTTSRSVLKLGGAQQDFFTLGSYLRSKGYDTSFIYGGEAQFDNMQGFFANNGFNSVHDKHDFENPVFYGSWGASDEDVFRYADQVFASRPADRPFFSLLFTTSNHTPWEFPDGRIELYSEPKASVFNAVKYADYAIGEFFRKARTSSYWDDTVFLAVSDHNSRVHGVDLVPIEHFHIPGLILGGSIDPQRWSRIASQIDLLPTVLSLIGISGHHPAVGVDLTAARSGQLPGRAFMQYGDTQAYLEADRVAVLRKDRPAAVYHYDESGYAPAEDDPELLARASALAAWPVIAYRAHEYHLP
jgi:phosphoglycerol transferase MdoB-like AlkP superfamily enzyme